MRVEDYLKLKEAASQLFAAQSDEERKACVERLDAEFVRIDKLRAERE